jgi:hypothetical protein
VDHDELAAVVIERNLIAKKGKCSRNDMHAVCNVLQGHLFCISSTDRHRGTLLSFYDRMVEEILADEYFTLITD